MFEELYDRSQSVILSLTRQSIAKT